MTRTCSFVEREQHRRFGVHVSTAPYKGCLNSPYEQARDLCALPHVDGVHWISRMRVEQGTNDDARCPACGEDQVRRKRWVCATTWRERVGR